MTYRLCLAAVAAVVVFTADRPAPADDAKSADGWVDLLAGGDLGQHWTTKGNWSLDKEGVAVLTPRPGEKGWERWSSYLWSKKTYGDFEVTFEYTVQKGGNSGFDFRVGDVDNPVAKGIEVQIYDSGSKAAGAKLTDHDSGGVIPGIPPTKNTAHPAGEWNQFHIKNQNDKLTIMLNGEVVNEVDLTKAPLSSRPKVGSIGFQDHGLPLSLRHVKVRELNGK